jgi:AcrR family transcriptional regulator
MDNTCVLADWQYSCIARLGCVEKEQRMTESRERIVEAILAVIADKGIERTTVRTVAAQAGVSVGAVQHHFRTKAQMLVAAMEHASAGMVAGIEEQHARGATAEELLRRITGDLAIDSDEGLVMGSVWLDFVATSRVNPELAEVHRHGWNALRGHLSRLISAALPARPDPDADAALLLACLDGITVSRVTEPDFMTAARAQEMVERMLDSLTE